ncbi:MAG: DUF3562 domain-containing protein [Deltaproteobacteria bacterium]|jgi:hypothetical protein|nr:DUF3562 domain-containing protein [Deltaproteobacteria bacterium]
MTTNKLQSANLLYEDEIEERQHSNAIEMIAMGTGTPVDEVKRLYIVVLERFKRQARVKDFLPILVRRMVESLLKKGENDSFSSWEISVSGLCVKE